MSTRLEVLDPALLALAAALLLSSASARGEALPVPRPFDPCPDGRMLIAAQTPADRVLESRVESNLAAVGLDSASEVDVTAVGGMVCLRGTAANASDSKTAETTAAATKGATHVFNRLRPPAAR